MSSDLPEEKISEFKEFFELYDKDGDGFISVKELIEVMKVLGQVVTEPEALEMMKNETGNEKVETIEFKDFLSLMSKKLRDVDSEEELMASFKVFDKDGTGKISVAELRHEMTKLEEKLSDEEIDELIKEVDIFGDGMINYAEMVKIILAAK